MDRCRLTFLILTILFTQISFGQRLNDLKLDYNVPESPAFSVLNANPSEVMRGSASQELVVNLISNILNSDGINSGLAVDFNPYLVFGGNIESDEEYRSKNFKRWLANTQLSFATASDDNFSDDLILSSGLRITLWDSKDPMLDKELRSSINAAIKKVFEEEEDEAPMGGGGDIAGEEDNADFELNFAAKEAILKAYEEAKERYTKAKGGSVSIGAALAGRAKSKSLSSDSLAQYRSQVWLSAQYDFGYNAMGISSMIMYRQDSGLTPKKEGLVAGVAIRKYNPKYIVEAEALYTDLKEGFEAGIQSEFYFLPQIVLQVSAQYQKNEMTGKYETLFQPGIKWNISENAKN